MLFTSQAVILASRRVVAALCLIGVLPPHVGPVSAASDTYELASGSPQAASVSAGGARAVRSLIEMRRDRTVVQQWDLSCGAAALATLLAYQHGDFVSEREIANGLIRRKEYIRQPELVKIRQGFSLLDLKRYVDQRGYNGIGYGQLTLEDLIEYAPIMVPVNLMGYNHFVVFRGTQRDRVLLSDPAWGNRTVRRERFERAWLVYPEIGKVGFIIKRRDGSTPPNMLAPRPKDFVMLR
jgi:predicted double-glycine peptidase